MYWAASQLNLPTLTDGGYDGAGFGVFTRPDNPGGGHVFDVDNARSAACAASANAASPCLPATGDHSPITTSPRKTDDIAKAALVLTHHEHGRIT